MRFVNPIKKAQAPSENPGARAVLAYLAVFLFGLINSKTNPRMSKMLL
jgi:hypothetical protein